MTPEPRRSGTSWYRYRPVSRSTRSRAEHAVRRSSVEHPLLARQAFATVRKNDNRSAVCPRACWHTALQQGRSQIDLIPAFVSQVSALLSVPPPPPGRHASSTLQRLSCNPALRICRSLTKPAPGGAAGIAEAAPQQLQPAPQVSSGSQDRSGAAPALWRRAVRAEQSAGCETSPGRRRGRHGGDDPAGS